MRRTLLLLLVAVALPAFAQGDAPPKLEPPPGATNPLKEPSVRTPVQKGDKVEPIRVGGQVVMLKVTPKDGPTYYLIDTTGNGNWMRRDSLDSGVSVPMWPIKTWE